MTIFGLANGKGIFICSNGNIYIGNWINDKKEGESEEIYNKSQFKGLFKNNNKIINME